MIVRATAARRVLEIGTGTGHAAHAIATALPDDGMLITLERDAALAALARQSLAAAGHAGRVSVMIGDATRYLHKIAGPFELILQDGEPSEYEALHERLVRLLAVSATLLTNRVSNSGKYNETLSRDARLNTVVLNVGDGLALSVRKRP
jgi:caffeoyl-CoA O-methyltransferase